MTPFKSFQDLTVEYLKRYYQENTKRWKWGKFTSIINLQGVKTCD